MRADRRRFLRRAGDTGLLAVLAGAGFIPGGVALAADWNATAFHTKDFRQALDVLGARSPAKSSELSILAPEIAENGAVVPVGVNAELPGLRSVAILVEKNPNPLAAIFDIPDGTLGELQTRVKMAESCNVWALARDAGGRYFAAAKEIKVTVGGCGG